MAMCAATLTLNKPITLTAMDKPNCHGSFLGATMEEKTRRILGWADDNNEILAKTSRFSGYMGALASPLRFDASRSVVCSTASSTHSNRSSSTAVDANHNSRSSKKSRAESARKQPYASSAAAVHHSTKGATARSAKPSCIQQTIPMREANNCFNTFLMGRPSPTTAYPPNCHRIPPTSNFVVTPYSKDSTKFLRQYTPPDSPTSPVTPNTPYTISQQNGVTITCAPLNVATGGSVGFCGTQDHPPYCSANGSGMPTSAVSPTGLPPPPPYDKIRPYATSSLSPLHMSAPRRSCRMSPGGTSVASYATYPMAGSGGSCPTPNATQAPGSLLATRKPTQKEAFEKIREIYPSCALDQPESLSQYRDLIHGVENVMELEARLASLKQECHSLEDMWSARRRASYPGALGERWGGVEWTLDDQSATGWRRTGGAGDGGGVGGHGVDGGAVGKAGVPGSGVGISFSVPVSPVPVGSGYCQPSPPQPSPFLPESPAEQAVPDDLLSIDVSAFKSLFAEDPVNNGTSMAGQNSSGQFSSAGQDDDGFMNSLMSDPGFMESPPYSAGPNQPPLSFGPPNSSTGHGGSPSSMGILSPSHQYSPHESYFLSPQPASCFGGAGASGFASPTPSNGGESGAPGRDFFGNSNFGHVSSPVNGLENNGL